MRLLIVILLFGVSCREPSITPKPRMFPKIIFPEYKYILFNEPYCPFTFNYASYGKIIKDTSYFGEKPESECWFNIELPNFNGELHCSYYQIENTKKLSKYIHDAFRLAREHQIKANYIDEIPIKKDRQFTGIIYNLEGPAASPFQFYLTDSVTHFFRASLYFNTPTRPDSIQPILEFVKRDVMEIINTFTFK